MNTIKKLALASVLLLASLCSCGGPAPGTADQEVVGYYAIGFPGFPVQVDHTPSAIQSVYADTGMLPNPMFLPDANDSFDAFWTIDNGGTQTWTDNGVHYNGNLNSMTFHVYEVKRDSYYDAYFELDVSVCATQGTGGACQYLTGFTAWPAWRMTAGYQNNQVVITLYDTTNTLYLSTNPVGWNYTTGPSLQYVYSPEVFFSIDPSDNYGGCKNDILAYDTKTPIGSGSNDVDTGHFNGKYLYGTGTGQATTPAYYASPTSQAKCGIHVNHYPQVQYDQIEWTNQGF